ncbi:MAG: hypothetical protein ACRC10_01240 [Thermoguttaceae bacterium]
MSIDSLLATELTFPTNRDFHPDLIRLSSLNLFQDETVHFGRSYKTEEMDSIL